MFQQGVGSFELNTEVFHASPSLSYPSSLPTPTGHGRFTAMIRSRTEAREVHLDSLYAVDGLKTAYEEQYQARYPSTWLLDQRVALLKAPWHKLCHWVKSFMRVVRFSKSDMVV